MLGALLAWRMGPLCLEGDRGRWLRPKLFEEEHVKCKICAVKAAEPNGCLCA